MSNATESQLAPAKLTLHLHITATRSDGYHLIDSEMVSLDLADRLEFAAGDELVVEGLDAGRIPTDDTNLVRKALKVTGRTAAVRLAKAIPTGGGLGGGSSDAAAVMRWAGVIDEERAAQLGADVPFCLRGGRAHVSGIGEVLEPLTFEPRTFTLVIPPVHVNTAAVFAAYDQIGPERSAAHSSQNHLEAAALAVEPEMRVWRERISEWTGQLPALAGSGATWFLPGEVPPPERSMLVGARWITARTTQAID